MPEPTPAPTTLLLSEFERMANEIIVDLNNTASDLIPNLASEAMRNY